jgi:hypothetical protein
MVKVVDFQPLPGLTTVCLNPASDLTVSPAILQDVDGFTPLTKNTVLKANHKKSIFEKKHCLS